MATNLLDLTADIVIAHASVTEMSSDELVREIHLVFATLDAIAKGDQSATIDVSDRGLKKQDRKTKGSAEEKSAPLAPAMAMDEAFKPDQVACMICGKSGMMTLKRHLAAAHGLKPGQYRKQFNIPREQPLAAVEYVEKRRKIAMDRGLGDKLVAAREAKKAKQRGS